MNEGINKKKRTTCAPSELENVWFPSDKTAKWTSKLSVPSQIVPKFTPSLF